jgi:HPt (histidine-containing phosphotransfer) domain-containing protein
MIFLPFVSFENRQPTPVLPTALKQRATCEALPIVEQPQQDAVSHPGFDAEAALARVDGDRELLRNMVGVFAAQWSSLSDEMARAGRHRDGAALERAAHTLKESLKSFGADEASRVAQELEACGRKGDFHAVQKSGVSLKTEVERLVNGLREFANMHLVCQ